MVQIAMKTEYDFQTNHGNLTFENALGEMWNFNSKII